MNDSNHHHPNNSFFRYTQTPRRNPPPRVVFTIHNPPVGTAVVQIPSIRPHLQPVMSNGQQVRVLFPANRTGVGAPPRLQPRVTLPRTIPPTESCFQPTRNPTRHRIAEPRVNIQNLDVLRNPSISCEKSPSSRRITPTFILRHEDAGRVSELKVAQLNLAEDTHEKWDKLLYSALTPSIYELLKHEFVLRLWRHPRWVDKKVSWKNGASAAQALRATVDQIIEGDVMWIYSTRGHLQKLGKLQLRKRKYEGI